MTWLCLGYKRNKHFCTLSHNCSTLQLYTSPHVRYILHAHVAPLPDFDWFTIWIRKHICASLIPGLKMAACSSITKKCGVGKMGLQVTLNPHLQGKYKGLAIGWPHRECHTLFSDSSIVEMCICAGRRWKSLLVLVTQPLQSRRKQVLSEDFFSWKVKVSGLKKKKIMKISQSVESTTS